MRNQFQSPLALAVCLLLSVQSIVCSATCFSSTATVTLQDGSVKSMNEVQIGDRVMVLHKKYEPVYSFGHKDDTTQTTFRQIYLDSEEPLEMSGDHLVFRHGEDVPVPASLLKVGDILQGQTGPQTVTKIGSVARSGLYAPLTPAGTIVVNGVVASGFVTFQTNQAYVSIGGVTLDLSYHFLSQIWGKPQWVYCRKISQTNCLDQKYMEGGISQWTYLGKSIGTWMFESPQEDAGESILRVLAFVALVPLILVWYVVVTVMDWTHWMLWAPIVFILIDLRGINQRAGEITSEEQKLKKAIKKEEERMELAAQDKEKTL